VLEFSASTLFFLWLPFLAIALNTILLDDGHNFVVNNFIIRNNSPNNHFIQQIFVKKRLMLILFFGIVAVWK
jgi:hypothetical protein